MAVVVSEDASKIIGERRRLLGLLAQDEVQHGVGVHDLACGTHDIEPMSRARIVIYDRNAVPVMRSLNAQRQSAATGSIAQGRTPEKLLSSAGTAT